MQMRTLHLVWNDFLTGRTKEIAGDKDEFYDGIPNRCRHPEKDQSGQLMYQTGKNARRDGIDGRTL